MVTEPIELRPHEPRKVWLSTTLTPTNKMILHYLGRNINSY